MHENLSWNSNIAGFFDYHYSKCDDKEGFLKYLSYILPIMATKLPKSIIQPAQEIVKSKILFKEINKWYTEKIGSKFEKVNKETEFTRRRTVLALHFLQQVGKFPKSSQDATKYELFYQFLTGKKSEFRKLISNPFKRPIDEKTGKSAKELIKDIEVVRKQFHSIDFFKADEIIDNKLDELDRDKKDY